MSDYLNGEYCDFSNDASASSFGWNFQSNAGIFLFLKYLKDSESIKIESTLQDIEIRLSSGKKILAQAKSAQDYTAAKDKKEKFKDALISLAKFSKHGEQLIYISNIPDTLDSAKDGFNNKIVSYSSCLQGMRDEIDQLFEAICDSMRAKIDKEKDTKKAQKSKQILELVECFDKTKLYISVITPYWGDDNNRYSEISNTILSFLVNDLRLSHEEAFAIKQKLLEHWQLKFQHNSSQPDKSNRKSISKMEFAWPVAVYLTKEGLPDIEDCLSFVPDQSLKDEVSILLAQPNMIYHERFEFSNKVIQSFIEFRNSKPAGTREVEKLFLQENGSKYCNEFKLDGDAEKIEYITKAYIYKILLNHRNMGRVSAGIGVKL
jgi:hypothetical protein